MQTPTHVRETSIRNKEYLSEDNDRGTLVGNESSTSVGIWEGGRHQGNWEEEMLRSGSVQKE